MSTRSSKSHYLIGSLISAIPENKLPSNGEVFKRFLHIHLEDKKTLRESAAITTNEVLKIWDKAKIPTSKDYHVIEKIKNLHIKWDGLKKSKHRKTPTQEQHENQFMDSMEDLFDIAHANALDMIQIPEDKEFLLAQRERGRRGYIGGVDSSLAKKIERKEQRVIVEAERKEKANKLTKYDDTVVLSGSSSSSSSIVVEQEYVPEKHLLRNKAGSELSPKFTRASSGREEEAPLRGAGRGRGRGVDLRSSSLSESGGREETPGPSSRLRGFFSPELSSALDRTKLSLRSATHVIAATAHSLGHNVEELKISKDTIRRERLSNRAQIYEDLKNSFPPGLKLVVHWDGKLLPSLSYKAPEDRLAVIVSGLGTTKILGIPKILNSTGEVQAQTVFELIKEWKIDEQIGFMSFDTTASNTGVHRGACQLLQLKLNRRLISLACRHHIFELLIAAAWESKFPGSTGPDIQIFKRFRNNWKFIIKENFEPGIGDEYVAPLIGNPQGHINSIKKQLLLKQPRDDYKELLELSLIFLGSESDRGIHILAPGALHRARWMAKLIYSLKIFIFRSQFGLSDEEYKKLGEFICFSLRTYLPNFFMAKNSLWAPRRDLQLVKNLFFLKEIPRFKGMVEAATKSFMRHLWYLSEELVGLAFFDEKIDENTKINMVESLKVPRLPNPPPRADFSSYSEAEICSSDFTVANLVSENTINFFISLGVPYDWIYNHPSTWYDNPEYQAAKSIASELMVVNDAAERGIALVQEYNNIITVDEEQRQMLFQVVEDHRREFPEATKSSLVEGFKRARSEPTFP